MGYERDEVRGPRAPGLVALSVLLAASLLSAQEGKKSDPEGIELFERKIRPVLLERCYKCHSAGSGKVKGGLLLDSSKGLLEGGDSGPAIVPGHPEKSLLVAAIGRSDKDLAMPPDGKEALSSDQVANFVAWIKRGAPDPREGTSSVSKADKPRIDLVRARDFWSFQALRDPAPPRVNRGDWPLNEVDRFTLAALEQRGLKPAPEADKRTLLRRATFDLIGLPPTFEEITAFVADDSPDAYAKVVDRLLASPHYGERWGRHWLDVVRYADTAGDAADFPIPQAWRYRNYVIDSFNQDKPYDQFLREQVAGDLMVDRREDLQQYDPIVATGYIALARRYGIYPERWPHLIIEDTLEMVGRSVLGLSIGCARCHDHKFDPISAKDYYALYGIFASTRYPHAGSEGVEGIPYQKGLVPLAEPAEIEKVVAPYLEKLADFERSHQQILEERKNADPSRKKRKELIAQRPSLSYAFAVSEQEPRDARIHRRGDPLDLGEEVPRRFLEVLGGQRLPAEMNGSGRLQLAQWLTSPSNPLTPRVMVNRVWQHHFGKGIVQTPNDFGSRGIPPTHPELLDYLATRFMSGGWSVKSLHRLIMLSRTYRISSHDDAENARIDPDNDYLWRSHRRRLDAESIRDSMLAVSGELDRTLGQGHPFPAENTWDKFGCGTPFMAMYETRHRSVYLLQQRLVKHPFLEVFDGANPNASTALRPSTTTPLQALYLMNDPFVHRQSEHLADFVLGEGGDDRDRIRRAYRLILGREPGPEELETAQTYIPDARDRLGQSPLVPHQRGRKAWASFLQILLAGNEFLFVD